MFRPTGGQLVTSVTLEFYMVPGFREFPALSHGATARSSGYFANGHVAK